MNSGLPGNREEATEARVARREQSDGNERGAERSGIRSEKIPLGVRSSALPGRGVYDARRLQSQREVIRDVMLAAADCDTWLTLGELRTLTKYGEASISAQLRHLRKEENGGFEVTKRHRENAIATRSGADGRGECVWEYCIARGIREGESSMVARTGNVGGNC